MKPHRLTLSGFKGIRDGLGLSSYTLEFQNDAHLVALKGRNGRGKTTLIDNLQPFRLLPSKVDGSWSPKAASMYEALDPPVAVKDLQWAHNNREYRSLCEWKLSGKTRTCTAFLFEIINGAEVAFTLSDGVMCDGKTETYDRAVEEILGPPEVFFTSAFSAQGKKPISAMQTGDAKRWLGNLLNQAPIRGMGERAKQVVKLLQGALQRKRIDALTHATLREQLAQCLQKLAADNLALQVATQQRETADEGFAKASLNLQNASALDGATAAIENRRALLIGECAQRATRKADIDKRLVIARTAEHQRKRSFAETRQAQVASHQRTRSTLSASVNEWAALLARRDEITEMHQRSQTLLQNSTERERELLPAARAKVDDYRRQQAEIDQLGRKLDGQRTQFASLRGIVVRAELAQSVPCHGTGFNGQCQLLSDARAAHALEPNAKQRLEELKQTGIVEGRSLEERKVALAKLADPALLVAGLEAKQREESAALAALAHVPGLVLSLASAGTKHAAALAALNQWEIDVAADLRRSDEAELAAMTNAQENISALEEQSVSEAELLEASNKELAALPISHADGVKTLELVKENAARVQLECRRRESALQSEIAAGCAKQCTLEAQIHAALTAHVQCEALQSQIADWSLLAEAFGDKGIIALEIDAAGPSIATEANRLLQSCYGARFSVELSTLVATTDGTMKEGFDIIVHDSHNNDTRPMSALSGGQRVWVNEAIIRSVAVYLAQAGERRYDTLFTDEVDGALDPERKHAFMAMKLALLKMGYFSREIFITQTPELLDYADQVIDLDAQALTT